MKHTMFQSVGMHLATLVALEMDKLYSKSKDTFTFDSNYYENGREHGFSVICAETRHQVSFSENRNSDNVVAYIGVIEEFNYCGIMNISDEEWKTRRFFFSGYGDGPRKAAKFIFKYLTTKDFNHMVA